MPTAKVDRQFGSNCASDEQCERFSIHRRCWGALGVCVLLFDVDAPSDGPPRAHRPRSLALSQSCISRRPMFWWLYVAEKSGYRRRSNHHRTAAALAQHFFTSLATFRTRKRAFQGKTRALLKDTPTDESRDAQLPNGPNEQKQLRRVSRSDLGLVWVKFGECITALSYERCSKTCARDIASLMPFI
jgi:hypothetical protein